MKKQPQPRTTFAISTKESRKAGRPKRKQKVKSKKKKGK